MISISSLDQSFNLPKEPRGRVSVLEQSTPVLPAALAAFSWFQGLDNVIVAPMATVARGVSYDRGESLWEAGTKPTHFIFIAAGLVQIVRPNARGDETTLGIFGPGEAVGNVAAVNQIDYPARAVAASEYVRVIRMPVPAVKEHLKRHPAFLAAANRELTRTVGALHAKIDILSAGPVAARLALLFIHLAERFGTVQPAGNITVPIALSRGCCAGLIAAREETVIRVISKWRQDGWVTMSPNGFEVHRPDMLQTTVSSEAPRDA